MADLSDFTRGQIVGARLFGISVTRVAAAFGCARSTVSTVMSAYRKHGKTSTSKQTCGRKTIMSDRDRRALKRIVTQKRRTTAAKITSEINTHLTDPVSISTVRRELHKDNMYGRAAIPKPLVTSQNMLKRRQWCNTHNDWTDAQWQRVIWSDESSFTLFPTSGRVYVWRTPAEAYHVDCLLPTVKHGGGAVMVWGAISWFGVGPLVVLDGRVTAVRYCEILADQVHPMAQTLYPDGRCVFQDDNAPIHTAGVVRDWFDEHSGDLEHLPWPPQSPDLNIIEHLWSVLESKLRARFPPPRSLSELKIFLHEEWQRIPVETVQNLYLSIGRRIRAVRDAQGAPTRY